MFQIGDIAVHVLSAGQVMVDAGGAFGLVPHSLWSRYQTPQNTYYVPMCLNSLLIKAGGKNIVVDVGHGDKLTDKLRQMWQMTFPNGTLLDGLARLGLTPADIDLVIDTHLHGDHAGGNTTYTADGQLVPTFPNAEYVVQAREYQDAMHPNERTRATYYPINYEPLYQTGQLRLLDGDSDLAVGVRGVMMPGHTPGHMGVHVYQGDQHLLFVCDLASYAVQFEKLGWMTAYDVEPLVTLESKRHWQKFAHANSAIVVFPHDVTMLAGRMTQDGDSFKLTPVTADEGAVYD